MNVRTYAMRLDEIAAFLDLQERCGSIEGWLHPLEGYLLSLLAAEGPGVGEIVEIGSYLGRSTAFLASGAKGANREKVTAVDHFSGSPEHQAGQFAESKILREEGTTLKRFLSNLQRLHLADHVNTLALPSDEAARGWNKPIRLLFIDGDHSFESAQRDFELWSPFIVPGGIVCFHDIGPWRGVTKFYHEMLQSTKTFKEAMGVYSVRVIERQKS